MDKLERARKELGTWLLEAPENREVLATDSLAATRQIVLEELDGTMIRYEMLRDALLEEGKQAEMKEISDGLLDRVTFMMAGMLQFCQAIRFITDEQMFSRVRRLHGMENMCAEMLEPSRIWKL
jgi:hypothetical protein